MNILLISEYFPPDQGGASTRIAILFNELIKQHNVTVITCSPHYPNAQKSDMKWICPIKRIRVKGALIIRLWIPGIMIDTPLGRMMNYCWFTGSFLVGMPFVEDKPDIIWSTSPNFFCGFTARMAKWYFKRPAIMNMDDVWPEAPIELGFLQKNITKWLAQQSALRAYNRKLDGFTPISDTIGNYYRHRYQLRNVITIPVGIEHSRIQQIIKLTKDGKKTVPARDGNGPIEIMYSGILGPAYDFKMLLKAMKRLRAQHNLRLVIRGVGPEKERIQEMIRQFGLDNVMMETTYLSVDDLNRRLLAADLFILPMVDNFISKTALPTKLFEYMAFGKPIILYGTGEPKMLLEKAKAGIACPKGSCKDFANCIEIMLAAQNEWVKYGTNGQKFILENYSSNVICDQAEKMFARVLGTPPEAEKKSIADRKFLVVSTEASQTHTTVE